MPTIPQPKDQWYVVQVLAGFENKIRDQLRRRIQTEEMGDYVFEVLVPEERVDLTAVGQHPEGMRQVPGGKGVGGTEISGGPPFNRAAL